MTQTPTAQSGPSDLLPCPFCGADSPHAVSSPNSLPPAHYIFCIDPVCMAKVEGRTMRRAELVWNRRATTPPAGARDAVTDSIYLRGLVGKLAQWQLRMSYNDSYFGEPAGMVKQVVAELARAVDPIYPPMPEPVDPLAGVTIYTATVPKATQPAAPGAGEGESLSAGDLRCM